MTAPNRPSVQPERELCAPPLCLRPAGHEGVHVGGDWSEHDGPAYEMLAGYWCPPCGTSWPCAKTRPGLVDGSSVRRRW